VIEWLADSARISGAGWAINAALSRANCQRQDLKEPDAKQAFIRAHKRAAARDLCLRSKPMCTTNAYGCRPVHSGRIAHADSRLGNGGNLANRAAHGQRDAFATVQRHRHTRYGAYSHGKANGDTDSYRSAIALPDRKQHPGATANRDS
jgi:hypothetical protein